MYLAGSITNERIPNQGNEAVLQPCIVAWPNYLRQYISFLLGHARLRWVIRDAGVFQGSNKASRRWHIASHLPVNCPLKSDPLPRGDNHSPKCEGAQTVSQKWSHAVYCAMSHQWSVITGCMLWRLSYREVPDSAIHATPSIGGRIIRTANCHLPDTKYHFYNSHVRAIHQRETFFLIFFLILYSCKSDPLK